MEQVIVEAREFHSYSTGDVAISWDCFTLFAMTYYEYQLIEVVPYILMVTNFTNNCE